MNLKQFKDHIESFPNGTQFTFGISEPFSWRGVYAQVAFEFKENYMSREDILKNIEMAHTEKFFGYKGGEYTYNDHTSVHFEDGYGSYTDGEYCAKWISRIEEEPIYIDQEDRLVKLAFKAQ